MSDVKITVRCIGCKSTKVVGREQRSVPMCERCLMPMIVEKVSA